MNTPPLLLGAAALFWGWLSGQLALSVVIAGLLEASRRSAFRFTVQPQQQERIADACVVMAALVGVGCYVVYGNPRAIVLLFQWLPVLLLPLALLQAWGSASAIPLAALFWSLRRRPRGGVQAVNLGYPYLMVWLIGACAANQRGAAATGGLAVLGAWALWQVRGAGAGGFAWGWRIGLAGLCGFALQSGLNEAQVWLEGAAPEWIMGAGGNRTNPYRSSTDLGSIGELKQSDDIILRVATGAELAAPPLLHRASYNEYGGISWLARGAKFTEVPGRSGGQGWTLRSGTAVRTLEVADFAPHGNPVLSLPAGALAIEAAAISMRANPLGAVQAEAAPGFLIYKVSLGDQPALAMPAGDTDLKVPRAEQHVIAQTVAALGIAGSSPQAAAQRIAAFLRDGFRYSTAGFRPADGSTPLAAFLRSVRAGHCEYFATATVLLLRGAGVPARYATGFSLQEYDPAQRAYIVRERHAHAWARVWLDGAWIDLDTTPPGWAAQEAAARGTAATLRAAFLDAWSGMRYRYARWELRSSEAEKWTLFGGVAVLVAGWLAWRTFGSNAARGAAAAAGDAPARSGTRGTLTGNDSAFYRIEAELGRQGHARRAAETTNEWLQRLASQGAPMQDLAGLRRLAHTHVRLRFDPAGIEAGEEQRFAAECQAWLTAHGARLA